MLHLLSTAQESIAEIYAPSSESIVIYNVMSLFPIQNVWVFWRAKSPALAIQLRTSSQKNTPQFPAEWVWGILYKMLKNTRGMARK